MVTKKFILYPFLKTGRSSDSNISGTLTRHDSTLTVNFELSALLEQIIFPSPEDNPARQHGLWKQTCFELFIKAKYSNPYWEFNLSPCGNWNIYRFDGYRKEMTEEHVFSELPFYVSIKPDCLKIELEIGLQKVLPSNPPLLAGVSAVIQDINEDIAYWALAHPGIKPDFHHPASFILEI